MLTTSCLIGGVVTAATAAAVIIVSQTVIGTHFHFHFCIFRPLRSPELHYFRTIALGKLLKRDVDGIHGVLSLHEQVQHRVSHYDCHVVELLSLLADSANASFHLQPLCPVSCVPEYTQTRRYTHVRTRAAC